MNPNCARPSSHRTPRKPQTCKTTRFWGFNKNIWRYNLERGMRGKERSSDNCLRQSGAGEAKSKINTFVSWFWLPPIAGSPENVYVLFCVRGSADPLLRWGTPVRLGPPPPKKKKQIIKMRLKNATGKCAVVCLSRAGEDRGALPNRLLNNCPFFRKVLCLRGSTITLPASLGVFCEKGFFLRNQNWETGKTDTRQLLGAAFAPATS